MDGAWLIIPIFSGVLSFAFAMAWTIPLMQAGEKACPSESTDLRFGFFDLILVVLDCIPFLAMLRGLTRLPAAHTAARELWHSDPSVRKLFRLFLASGTVFMGSMILFFRAS